MTILEHLQQLPEKYREAAIRNTLNDEPMTGNDYAEYRLSKSLSEAFIFHHSPEGHNYWYDVVEELEAQEE